MSTTLNFLLLQDIPHCLLYKECNEVSNRNCQNCFTGQPECHCFLGGRCTFGSILNITHHVESDESTHAASDEVACLKGCRKRNGDKNNETTTCAWASYNARHKLCYFYADCGELDTDRENFTTTHVNCTVNVP